MDYIIKTIDGTEYLAHHGIKGMKWGVRRYQNSDGTLTELGKQRALRGKKVWQGSMNNTEIALGWKHGTRNGKAVLVGTGAAYKASLFFNSRHMTLTNRYGRFPVSTLSTAAIAAGTALVMAKNEYNYRRDMKDAELYNTYLKAERKRKRTRKE